MGSKSENKVEGEMDTHSIGDTTEYGGYYIEDGKINMVTKINPTKMPKSYGDSIKVQIVLLKPSFFKQILQLSNWTPLIS